MADHALGGQLEDALRTWLVEGLTLDEMQRRLIDGGLEADRAQIAIWLRELQR